MDSSKGMSQVLALIVAAGVLMMAALTVIALTSTQLGILGEGTRGSSCIQTISAQCQAQGNTGSVRAPGSCFTDGVPTQRFQDSQYGSASMTTGAPVSCS